MIPAQVVIYADPDVALIVWAGRCHYVRGGVWQLAWTAGQLREHKPVRVVPEHVLEHIQEAIVELARQELKKR